MISNLTYMRKKNNIRIDKFLWAVRLCKTRKIASNVCTKRKIKINNIISKASKIINIGDSIKYNKNNVIYEYKVITLTENRLPAKLISNYLIDKTPQKELDKLKIKTIYPILRREKGTGRPTKKERRTLKKHKLIN